MIFMRIMTGIILFLIAVLITFKILAKMGITIFDFYYRDDSCGGTEDGNCCIRRPSAGEGTPESDKELLAAIIHEQNARGARCPEDPGHRRYKWDKEGRLVKLNLRRCRLSGHLSLTGLDALMDAALSFNKLTVLDVRGCRSLRMLTCGWNRLRNLNVNDAPALKYLDCKVNDLKRLDMGRKDALDLLDCSCNLLELLDVRGCPALSCLYCQGNRLTELDLTGSRRLLCLSYSLSMDDIRYGKHRPPNMLGY